MSWNLNIDGYKEISFLVFRNMLHPVSFELKNLSMLSPCLNFDGPISENWELHGFFDSKNRLHGIDLNRIEEISIFSRESIDTIWDTERNIEISAFGTNSIVSFPADFYGHSVVDSRRYFDFLLGFD